MINKLIEKIESQIEAFDKDANDSLEVSYTVASKTALYRAGKLYGMCAMLIEAGVPEDKANEVKKNVAAIESKWLHQLHDKFHSKEMSDLDRRIADKKVIVENANGEKSMNINKKRGMQYGE